MSKDTCYIDRINNAFQSKNVVYEGLPGSEYEFITLCLQKGLKLHTTKDIPQTDLDSLNRMERDIAKYRIVTELKNLAIEQMLYESKCGDSHEMFGLKFVSSPNIPENTIFVHPRQFIETVKLFAEIKYGFSNNAHS